MHQDQNPSLDDTLARLTAVASEVPSSNSQTFRAAFADLGRGARSHELWLQLGWQDIKQRYRRSTLGPLWITVATGVMALALGLLYSMLFQLSLREFLPHVTVGLILWGFIAGCIQDGAKVFVENEGLIKQLPSALSVHVYRLVWRHTLFLAHNLVIWVLLVLLLRVDLGVDLLLAIPALALFIVNGVWVAMLFGIIATRFRDVAPLLESLIQLLFYITPIVWTTYTLEEQGGQVAERAKLAQINPLYHYLDIVRAPMIGHESEAIHWIVVGCCSGVGLLLAALVMRQWRYRVSYWV
ncbi:galactan export ABC transporter permease subunit Wzm/RfbD [Corynebacterium uterequi]|uniref:ABC-type polysaccharide/polyol phosphate export systems, permease component n=1 Tax=Corynebacterium uterequi TaxID=1072256 RepID=A0A0G3HA02_9CORY|nr:ABC transporter permease [Corynebacterium uterequi]AKK10124.1 ABC-type polysaccharide/polyol phosphate export systems, permease component [Corynebacterium uterequi]